MSNLLNGVPVPNGVVWADKLNYSTITQKVTKSVTGHIVIQRGQIKEGRPIQLTGNARTAWCTYAEARALSDLRLDLNPLTLDYNGVQYLVRFALHETDHFVVKPLYEGTQLVDDDDKCYIEKISLIEVLG